MRICWQRAFEIHRERLNLFLVFIGTHSDQFGYFEAEYIFQREDKNYCVVASEFVKDPSCHGSSYSENRIIQFAKAIHPDVVNNLEKSKESKRSNKKLKAEHLSES